MGLKIETWNIAYRKKAMKTFRDTNEPFTVIPNGYKGWYADPFLFDYQGISYLFAEFFSLFFDKDYMLLRIRHFF